MTFMRNFMFFNVSQFFMILGQFFRIRLKNLNTYFVGCLQLHIDWDLCYCIGVVLAKYFAVMLGNDKLIARTAAVT